MANFASNSLSFLDHNDINWDMLNPFMAISNPSLLQNSNLDYQNVMGFGSDGFLTHQTSALQAQLLGNVQTPVTDPSADSELVNQVVSCSGTTRNKRKAEDFAQSSSLNSSSPMSSTESTKKNNLAKGKRVKTNDKAGEKTKEVVHVRARRGQATDSHSIAERIRRGKINEKLKSLQDIVPGCSKTMGMAGMLDEIINYVQSLQNQVEFLSMKLTAASQFHDFSAETTPLEKMQKIKACNSDEAQPVEMMLSRGGYDQGLANFIQTAWPF